MAINEQFDQWTGPADLPALSFINQMRIMAGRVTFFVWKAGGVFNLMPFLTPASGGVRVQVSPTDEEQAREVLGS